MCIQFCLWCALIVQVNSAVAALPKKANWDLKRDIEARLAKLDRQTQRSITEIVREKVRSQQKTIAADVPAAIIVSASPAAAIAYTPTARSVSTPSSAPFSESAISTATLPPSPSAAERDSARISSAVPPTASAGVGAAAAAPALANELLDEQFDFSAAGIDPAALMQAMATVVVAGDGGGEVGAVAAPISSRTRRGGAAPASAAATATPSPQAEGGGVAKGRARRGKGQ